MPKRVVVDSGPLVALFDNSDQLHSAAMAFIRSFDGELITTLAAVTEVCYLLDFSRAAQLDFLTWLGSGAVRLVGLEANDLARVIELMEKYADLPMDFTDATLVAIAEHWKVRDVASADSDFDVYRYGNQLPFRNCFRT
jgi:predicted nucleic acid-binding protein